MALIVRYAGFLRERAHAIADTLLELTERFGCLAGRLFLSA